MSKCIVRCELMTSFIIWQLLNQFQFTQFELSAQASKNPEPKKQKFQYQKKKNKKFEFHLNFHSDNFFFAN